MLLSLSRRYIFLANRKAASTSIESAFGPECEIATGIAAAKFAPHPVTGRGGKHMTYRECRIVHARLFERVLPIEGFCVFGIVREPLDRLWSYFRYQARWAEAKPHTVGRSFDDFVRRAVAATSSSPKNTVESQHDFFRDEDGAIRLNYLVRLDNMAASLAILRDATGLDFTRAAGTRLNISSSGPPELADKGLRRAVEERFTRDYDLYETMTDRLLAEPAREGRVNPDNVLRWMHKGPMRFDIAASIAYKLRRRLARDPRYSIAGLLRSIDED